MTAKNEMTLSKHIAGIIPVSKVPTDINLVLPPSALPIGNDFYAIQRSIVECSYMGCKTIWIVCDESVAPLLKKICGDFVLNLAQHERSKFTNFPKENRTTIPIFYVPVSYKHMNKEGIGVSIMEGVGASFTVSDKISKWVTPYKYYISVPYGVYNCDWKQAREGVRNSESFYLKSGQSSFRSGDYLGFSFSVRQYKHCLYLFKKMNVKSDYAIDILFKNDIMIENSDYMDVEEYFDISSWEGYLKMMSEPPKILTDWRYCFTASFTKDERK